jgi:hypothetical protein
LIVHALVSTRAVTMSAGAVTTWTQRVIAQSRATT